MKDPLPNPWAPRSQQNPPPGGAGTSTGTASNITPGVFNSPGMQSLMQQMTASPGAMGAMFDSPQMQAAMQMLASNPELAQQVGIFP